MMALHAEELELCEHYTRLQILCLSEKCVSKRYKFRSSKGVTTVEISSANWRKFCLRGGAQSLGRRRARRRWPSKLQRLKLRGKAARKRCMLHRQARCSSWP